MGPSVRLTLIMPVYNEEKRIVDSLNRLLSFLESSPMKDSYEILIAADGCTDGTVLKAQRLSSKYSALKVLDSPRRLGKGGGILRALTFAQGNVVVFMDADLPVSLEKLLDLIGPIENNQATVVIGSRYLPRSRISKNFPATRRIASKAFSQLVRFLFKIKVSDTQCGFKAFKRSAVERFSSYVTAHGYTFDVDILASARYHGHSVCEIAVDWTYYPESKLKLSRDPFAMFWDLYRLWIKWRRLQNRKHAFSPKPRSPRSEVGGSYFADDSKST